jgi:hypothetical protein
MSLMDPTPVEPDAEGYIDLVHFISNEVSSARSQIRMDLTLGDVHLEDSEGNEEKLEGEDRHRLKTERLEGKTLFVRSESHGYAVRYRS